jgi:hypothetical protein
MAGTSPAKTLRKWLDLESGAGDPSALFLASDARS